MAVHINVCFSPVSPTENKVPRGSVFSVLFSIAIDNIRVLIKFPKDPNSTLKIYYLSKIVKNSPLSTSHSQLPHVFPLDSCPISRSTARPLDEISFPY